MTDTVSPPSTKYRIASIIILSVLALIVIAEMVTVFQTRNQMISPLIPPSTIEEVVAPHHFKFRYSLTLLGFCVVIFKVKKYLIVVIAAIAGFLVIEALAQHFYY